MENGKNIEGSRLLGFRQGLATKLLAISKFLKSQRNCLP